MITARRHSSETLERCGAPQAALASTDEPGGTIALYVAPLLPWDDVEPECILQE